jgi:hypothetical protein
MYNVNMNTTPTMQAFQITVWSPGLTERTCILHFRSYAEAVEVCRKAKERLPAGSLVTISDARAKNLSI